jgi:hypothetical protein
MTAAAKTDLLDLSRQLDADAAHAPGMPLLHKVRAGDTVSQIILDNYGVPPGSPLYRQAEAQLLYFNRDVTDVNRIRVGQTLRLLPLPAGGGGVCKRPDEEFHFDPWGEQPASRARHFLEPADPNYVERIGIHIPTDPAEREAFWALAWLDQNHNWLMQPAGVGLGAFGLLTGPGNASLLQQVGADYERYRRGELTKGQYDYRRRQALRTFSQKVGPAERLILRGQRANEAIRISRGAGIPATARIDVHASHLAHLSKYATRGSVVLAGAGVYMGCRQIAATSSRQEKNEILVETVTSTGVGAVAGLVVAAVLIANPVGLTLALVASTGVAASGLVAGDLARRAWNRWGGEVDLVSSAGIDLLCN